MPTWSKVGLGSRPVIPHSWMEAMGDAGKLNADASVVRLHEIDEFEIVDLMERYGLKKAAVIRILIHNALAQLEHRSAA